MSSESPAREATYFKNHQRRTRFPWNLYHKDLQRRVSRAVTAHGDQAEVLVVGCGFEPFVEGVPPSTIFSGCDLDPRAIERCRELYPEMAARLHVSEGPYQLFKEGLCPQFDVVVAKEVIEHTIEPERWARELAQYVRPGGELVLTTPNYSLTSSLAVLEYTVLEAIARKDGYSRLKIHPSKFTPRRLKALDLGSDMQLLGVESTWTNWALVGRWQKRGMPARQH